LNIHNMKGCTGKRTLHLDFTNKHIIPQYITKNEYNIAFFGITGLCRNHGGSL
jgi:hypothetical protein